MNTLTLHDATALSTRTSAPATAASPAPFRIAAGAVLTLRHGRGRCVEVIEGSLWITARGDAQDHFAGPGRRHALGASEWVVLEALGPGPAWLRITPR